MVLWGWGHDAIMRFMRHQGVQEQLTHPIGGANAAALNDFEAVKRAIREMKAPTSGCRGEGDEIGAMLWGLRAFRSYWPELVNAIN